MFTNNIKMSFDIKYLVTLFVLGIILLCSYYYYYKTYSYSPQLWGRIKKPFIYIYYISMILAAIGFVLLFYYLFQTIKMQQKDIDNIFYTLLTIVIVSMFWMPLSLQYIKDKKTYLKWIIIFILSIVSLSSFVLIYQVYNINDTSLLKNLALFGIICFSIHVFIFDNILWSLNFF